MPLTSLVAPTWEPVSLAEARAHLRVDGEDDDILISGLIAAARGLVEHHCERAIPLQNLRLTLDSFTFRPVNPDHVRIELPRPPLVDVTEISYVAPGGATVILDPAAYQISRREPALLVPAPGRCWPAVRRQLDAVTIDYSAGWPNAEAVPAPIKQAMLLLIGQWFENREPVNIGNTVTPLPFTVDALLSRYRVWSVA
jgi:uncharacterized phiE125 gp8 family phage protein